MFSLGAWSSLRRIEQLLLKEDKHGLDQDLARKDRADTLCDSNPSSKDLQNTEKPSIAIQPEVRFENASVGLGRTAYLTNLNIVYPAGELTMVTGSVACVRVTMAIQYKSKTQ